MFHETSAVIRVNGYQGRVLWCREGGVVFQIVPEPGSRTAGDGGTIFIPYAHVYEVYTSQDLEIPRTEWNELEKLGHDPRNTNR